MIPRTLLPLAALLTLAALGPAQAAPRDDYYAACLKASDNNVELCTCKADEAVKLLDEEMFGFVTLAMADPQKFTTMENNGEIPDEIKKKWGPYVMKSNAVCRPDN